MRHVTPVVGAIWHAGWSDRAIEDVAINAGAIDNGSQAIDDGGVRRVPREVDSSRGTTLGRHDTKGSKRNRSGITGDVHLSKEKEIQTGDYEGNTEETVKHPVHGNQVAPCHLYRLFSINTVRSKRCR